MAFGNQNRAAVAYGSAAEKAQIDEGLRQYMLTVYNYMATGLAISGLVAWIVANVQPVTMIFFNVQGGQVIGMNALGMAAMFAPLGMLLIAMFAMRSPSAKGSQIFYWAFVAINGVGLSLLLLIYTGESVVKTFFITAGAFAALSLYGYTTKRNLSGLGSFLLMGLVGLILASLVTMFMGGASPMMTFIISVGGVLIFSGLIVFYTQQIKDTYVQLAMAGAGRDEQTVTAVWGALSLYIAFINLLQFLLMLLGNRE